MARITAPQFAVSLVNELFSHLRKGLAGNPLWYPARTTVSRAVEGRGNAVRAIVPDDSMPGHLGVVLRAIDHMPEDIQLAIVCRHEWDYAEFERLTGKSAATWYQLCNAGYWCVSGAVNSKIDK